MDVTVDAQGVPAFVIHPNVAWDHIPWNPQLRDLAARADAICFGSLAQRNEVSRRTILQFLATTRPACLRIFDINLRQTYYNRDIVETSLRQATMLKLNDQELPLLGQLLQLGCGSAEVVGGLLKRYPLQLVVLTRGGAGSCLISRSGQSDHPGYPARVVDTVGAGDAFTAAVALGLLRKWDLDRINAHANELASYVCSQPGATPPIPAHLSEVHRAAFTQIRTSP